MEILREEVLGEVIGGAGEIQNMTNSYIRGVKDGFTKDFGPLSIVRGTAQFLDDVNESGKSHTYGSRPSGEVIVCDAFNAIGKISGGMAQTYVVTKVAQFVYKKLSKNKYVKEFLS